MKLSIYKILFLTPLLLVVLFCREAWALQTHGGVEGVVVHQLAHIQYLGALVNQRITGAIEGTATSGGTNGVLMMAWNGIAFIGHFAQMTLGEGAISTEDGYLSALLLLPVTFGKWVYYITALDHLVCVPALFFLYLAMRSFYRSLDKEKREED